MKTAIIIKIIKLLYKPLIRKALVEAAKKTDNDIDDKLIGILDKVVKSL